MAITLGTSARNAAADAVVDLVDAGAAAGTLVIQTSGGTTTLATITLSDPAFGNAASGTATLSGTPLSDASADATGTAAQFQLRDSDANVILTGTVTATGGGGDMELDSTSITAGQTVNITSLTITMPAS